jgi:hypothetical protein
MNTKKLLLCFGEINDLFVEEAETADVSDAFAPSEKRKRLAKYGALGLAAAFGIAVTVKFVRGRMAVAAKAA